MPLLLQYSVLMRHFTEYSFAYSILKGRKNVVKNTRTTRELTCRGFLYRGLVLSFYLYIIRTEYFHQGTEA